jgi:hypothetical protein
MTNPLLDPPPDDRFEFRPSTIPGAGLGVFARVPLPAGAELEVVGVLVRRDSVADCCTHFADHHKFTVGADLLLVPVSPGGMVNHSPDANLERVEYPGRVVLRARRPVAVGEELFFTYSAGARERLGLS